MPPGHSPTDSSTNPRGRPAGRISRTLAALAALVLAAAAGMLYWIQSNSGASLAEEHALVVARDLAKSAAAHWTDERSVDFGKPIDLSSLQSATENWALVRTGVHVEQAAGFFGKPDFFGKVDNGEIMEHEGRRFRVAMVPLIGARAPTLDDIPSSARQSIEAIEPEARLLAADHEAQGSSKLFKVLKLTTSEIVELHVSVDGQVVYQRRDDLPLEIDPRFFTHAPKAIRPWFVSSLRWASYEGQLLAVISGTTRYGNETKVAFNRLAEVFLVDRDLSILGPARNSSLVVVSAIDAEEELRHNRALLTYLLIGTPGLWLALVLLAKRFTRKAKPTVAAAQ